MKCGVPLILLFPLTRNFYSVNLELDLPRLQHERDFLEYDLANCVTYMHALRKKQARN
jgi:hypothetical protein